MPEAMQISTANNEAYMDNSDPAGKGKDNIPETE